MATVEVKGLRELGEALKAFPDVLGKKYLRRATFRAAETIAQDAVARANSAPKYPAAMQQIAKNIAVFKRKSDADTAHYAVGVRRIRLSSKVKRVLRIMRRAGQPIRIENDTFFWWWFEKGTRSRVTKKGANRGKIEAQPFLRPAFEAQKENALVVFKTDLAEGVMLAARVVSKS
jgi:HK97 gp10 family phage protein